MGEAARRKAAQAVAGAFAGVDPASVPIIGAPKRPTEYPQLDKFYGQRIEVEAIPGAAVYRLLFGVQLEPHGLDNRAKGRLFELRLADHAPLSVMVREIRALVESMEAALIEFPPAGAPAPHPEGAADAESPKDHPNAGNPPTGAEHLRSEESPGQSAGNAGSPAGLIARA